MSQPFESGGIFRIIINFFKKNAPFPAPTNQKRVANEYATEKGKQAFEAFLTSKFFYAVHYCGDTKRSLIGQITVCCHS
jgi:hypothetical protein